MKNENRYIEAQRQIEELKKAMHDLRWEMSRVSDLMEIVGETVDAIRRDK